MVCRDNVCETKYELACLRWDIGYVNSRLPEKNHLVSGNFGMQTQKKDVMLSIALMAHSVYLIILNTSAGFYGELPLPHLPHAYLSIYQGHMQGCGLSTLLDIKQFNSDNEGIS